LPSSLINGKELSHLFWHRGNGFIELAELGCGVKRQSHKIALIKNWQHYGTEDFRPGRGKSKAGPVNRGFTRRNEQADLETTSETEEGTTLETKAVGRAHRFRN